MSQRLRGKKDAGFTLIELLIVIIILGILAAIVVFAIGSTRKNSVAATCQTDVKSIVLAEEAWNTQKGAYTSGATAQADLTGTDGTLKSWPTAGADPANDNLALTLGSSSSDGGYTITIKGQNFPVAGRTVKQTDTSDGTVKTACTPTA
jgi:prepilin-type N-terminal cleavage/methylation domain-containing protein